MKTFAVIVGWLFGFVVAVWTMWVISYAVFQTFFDVTQINAAVTSALGVVVGLPAGVGAIVALTRRKDKANVG